MECSQLNVKYVSDSGAAVGGVASRDRTTEQTPTLVGP
jgi:hypothetical protein